MLAQEQLFSVEAVNSPLDKCNKALLKLWFSPVGIRHRKSNRQHLGVGTEVILKVQSGEDGWKDLPQKLQQGREKAKSLKA